MADAIGCTIAMIEGRTGGRPEDDQVITMPAGLVSTGRDPLGRSAVSVTWFWGKPGRWERRQGISPRDSIGARAIDLSRRIKALAIYFTLNGAVCMECPSRPRRPFPEKDPDGRQGAWTLAYRNGR